MKAPRTLCVVPARYASRRLPGKPLKELAGRPLILHTLERAAAATAVDWVVAATDDERIARVVREAGRDAVLTPELPSGTHRVAWVARKVNCRFVLNLQGDEPLVPPSLLNALVARLSEGEAEIVTAVHPADDPADYADPNCVKVVVDSRDRALYFSRAPLPHRRDGEGPPPGGYLRHVGLYGFTRAALAAAVELPPNPLEEAEGLEQLRWLAGGMRIACVRCDFAGVGVDTPADLERVRRMLEQQREDSDAR